MSNNNIDELIANEMKRRLEIEASIARQTGWSKHEVSKRFAEYHTVNNKYFDLDQRKLSGYNYFRMMKTQGKVSGEWNTLSSAEKKKYEAEAERFADEENANSRFKAVNRAVKSVKAIMKIANDVYDMPSVFIHGYMKKKEDANAGGQLGVDFSFICEGGAKISEFTRDLRSSHKRKFVEAFAPEEFKIPRPADSSKEVFYNRREEVTIAIKQKLVDAHVLQSIKQNVPWKSMILPESSEKGIVAYNWPEGVPFERPRTMNVFAFDLLETMLKEEQTPEGQEKKIFFRQKVE